MLVEATHRLPSGYLHLTLRMADGSNVPEMCPGQFVEVAVDKAKVLLNRPLSIYNRTDHALELLVNPIGEATRALCEYQAGEHLRVIGPLGNGFTTDFAAGSHVLLIGGGVGIAPLYYLIRTLIYKGVKAELLYGNRTAPDAELMARFEALAPVHICTDDGTQGVHGFVTNHPLTDSKDFDFVQICGPKPMMKACAVKAARNMNTPCEVSLENMMACGIGACLCCVEGTPEGNICVCKSGPVFNTEKLQWK